MRLIVAGCRWFADYQAVCDAIRREFPRATEIVCGMARGADALGARYAAEHGMMIAEFPADWDKWGKAAGPIRNAEMACYGDALLAFWDGKSRGTANMIETMKRKGKPVLVVECIVPPEEQEAAKP